MASLVVLLHGCSALLDWKDKEPTDAIADDSVMDTASDLDVIDLPDGPTDPDVSEDVDLDVQIDDSADPDVPTDVTPDPDAVDADSPDGEVVDPDADADPDPDFDIVETVEADAPTDPVTDEVPCTGVGPRLPDVRITNTGGDSIAPSLAWSGSEFGVSWQEDISANTEIFFVRMSTTGTELSAETRITSFAGASQNPSVAWTGTEFGVSWDDYRDSNYEIYFARVSSLGAKIGGDVRITNAADGSSLPSLAWTGTEFGVGWNDRRDGNYEIYFARISPSGAKVGLDERMTSTSTSVSQNSSLVWTGTEFGLSWEESGQIYFARISADAIKVGSDVSITSSPGNAFEPSLAWAGSFYGVSWHDTTLITPEIHFARISAAGSKLGSDVNITTYSSGQQYSSLAWNGTEFGVVWEDDRWGDPEVYFAQISAAGTRAGADVRVTSSSGLSSPFSLVSSGSEFGVGWVDSRDGNTEIYFNIISYCP